MSWLQLELHLESAALTRVEACLFECGAAAVTLLNDAQEAVLEPAPGETPLWHALRLRALLPLDADIGELRAALDQIDPGLLVNAEIDFVSSEPPASQPGIDEVFAGRLRLRPKPSPGGVPVRVTGETPVSLYLDAGLAFGSGSHPTTRLCLGWLAAHVRRGDRLLDFGCGSGILSIGAALLGATAVAVDHDAQAVMAARENAHYNSVYSSALRVLSLDEWRTEADQRANKDFSLGFDVLVANILARPLLEFASEFQSVVRPGGTIVLSGILHEHLKPVRDAYDLTQFQAPLAEAEWQCLVGTVQSR